MNSVNIADLKNQLSTYLNQVRSGEEIIIKDRNLPIAKIVPLSLADDTDAEELALIASGQMIPRGSRGYQAISGEWAAHACRSQRRRGRSAVIARNGDGWPSGIRARSSHFCVGSRRPVSFGNTGDDSVA